MRVSDLKVNERGETEIEEAERVIARLLKAQFECPDSPEHIAASKEYAAFKVRTK